MDLCKCGTYNDEKSKFCCNCGKLLEKDIYSVQLAWKLIVFGIILGGLGYAFEIIILTIIAVPIFFLGLVRIGLSIDMGS